MIIPVLPRHIFITTILSLVLIVFGTIITINIDIRSTQKSYNNDAALARTSSQAAFTINKYYAVKKKITDYKRQGVNTGSVEEGLIEVKGYIFAKHNYPDAMVKLAGFDSFLDALLTEKIAYEKTFGNLSGKVNGPDNKPLDNATVQLIKDGKVSGETKSANGGTYNFSHFVQGSYSVKVTMGGYILTTKNINIEAEKTATLDFALTKYVPLPPRPTAAPAPSTSPYGSYERKSVATSRGTYTVDLITADLSNGAIKMSTDTGANSDCTNNCPVNSLATYYARNNGFAAINGTYFCPSDYSSCVGKTGWFFWRVFNSRLRYMFNANDSYTGIEPAMVFNTDNSIHFYPQSQSFSANGSTQAAVGGAALVYNGQINLNYSRLDSKQQNTKSLRGALGVRGTIVYAAIVRNATVIDSAYVMQALGVTHALNLDGGGSSSLMYNGSYKVGPGRAIPNAIIFSRR